MSAYVGFNGLTDGMNESERKHLRDSERLDELEAKLFDLPDFQNQAFDSQGDDLVLAAGSDCYECERAIERTLKRHCEEKVNEYTVRHFQRCLLDSWLWQQIDAVEYLIWKYQGTRSSGTRIAA